MNHIGGKQGMGMRPDVRADVLARLKSGYGFKEVKGWLREGKCPQCGEKELFVSAENPWRVKCGRYNRCGYEASTKELFPDAFGRWNERFPATTEDPNATADAYMDGERGLPLRKIRGWFRQGKFHHPHGNRTTATVVFDLDRERGIFMERFVEPVVVSIPGKEPDPRKANFVGKHAGMAWVPPGVDVASLAELWLVEGCINAISLTVRGTPAAATLSSSNYPADLLAKLDPKKTRLVWALDNDAAGTTAIHKHAKSAIAAGFECRAALIPQGKQKTDWNDAYKAGDLTGDGAEKFLDLCLFEGDLLLARNAREKGTLVWERTRSASFAIIYDRRTYWYRFDQGAYDKQLEEIQNTGMQDHPRGQEFAAAEKSATVTEIANCETKFLYFQQNKATDESWYYSLIKFPDGRRFKNTFTGSQLSAGSEFKKRLMTIAPGALYLGGTNQLNWIIGKHLDGIKVVDTVDFIGYSREHKAWVFPAHAVSGGKVYKINEEDFFEIGKVSVKSLNGSLPIVVGKLSDYSDEWLGNIYATFGGKGIVAAAFWLGSLFAEHIREKHKSLPYLEIVGKAGAGKSTLIEFLWKLIGRADYEGFDPNKATAAARARLMSQVANMPVCLIESDRGGEGDMKAKQFDWDELKTAYNGRASRATGVKNGGNDTKEPPFRGAIVISQNTPVSASEAIQQRIVHQFYTCDGHTEEGKRAADWLSSVPVERVSNWLLQATCAEKDILATIFERTPKYEAALRAEPEIRLVRIAKNHAQLMAMVDALSLVAPLKDEWRKDAMETLRQAAIDRQRSLAKDDPLVEEFWELVEFIGIGALNHARDMQRIAINLNHLQAVAIRSGQKLPDLLELKKRLRSSTSRPFIALKAVNSGHPDFEGKTVKCWTFGTGTPASRGED
jgi:hypothetical protein